MKPLHVAFEVSRDEHYRSDFLKSIKENWPSMAKDYRHFCHVAHPKQGDVWVWTSSEGQKFVHFILDDENQTAMTFDERMHFYRLALRKLAKNEEFDNIEKISFPKGSFKFSDSELKQAQKLFEELFVDQGRSVLIQA